MIGQQDLNALFKSIVDQEKTKKRLYENKEAARLAYQRACKKEEELQSKGVEALIGLDEKAFILINSAGSFCFTFSGHEDKPNFCSLIQTKAHRF